MTQLLPKKSEEFSLPSYWNDFFNKRGEKTFEWYGDASSLGPSLTAYLRKQDRVLQIGCGNSKLGDYVYDCGYVNVVSVDISERALRTQAKSNGRRRRQMAFVAASACALPFVDHCFNVVFDKGTLDALLPTEASEHVATVGRMFAEVDRLLSAGGRYLVFSLCQAMVLRQWLAFFGSSNYLVRIVDVSHAIDHQTATADVRFPLFCLVATKMSARLPAPYIEMISGENARRKLSSVQECEQIVNGMQEYALFCNAAKSRDLTEEMSIDLHSAYQEEGPRFTVTLVQNREKERKRGMPYAAFIVPQGRESEWLFSTTKGRQKLCNASKAERLAIVFLHRGHRFGSLDDVSQELNSVVLDFAPAYCGKKIPFLSYGDDLGERTFRAKGKTQFDGDYIVEDVNAGGRKVRKLIFLKSQSVVQSEAFLDADGICVDCGHLASIYHQLMVRGLALTGAPWDSEFSVCVVGLGGGCLPAYLNRKFPEIRIVCVELDPAVVEVAKTWFAFTPNWRLESVVDDGLRYLDRAFQENWRFNVLIMDVSADTHKQGLVAPIPEFLTEDCLNKMKTIVSPKGILVMNLVTGDEAKADEVKRQIRSHFACVAAAKVEEQLNEVLFCFPSLSKSKLMACRKPLLDELANVEARCGRIDLSETDISANVESHTVFFDKFLQSLR